MARHPPRTYRARGPGPRRVGSSRGKTAPPARSIALRVDSALVIAGVMNNHGLGPFVTSGSQSGSTRPEACGTVLPDTPHASSTRRRPRSLAREVSGRGSLRASPLRVTAGSRRPYEKRSIQSICSCWSRTSPHPTNLFPPKSVEIQTRVFGGMTASWLELNAMRCSALRAAT